MDIKTRGERMREVGETTEKDGERGGRGGREVDVSTVYVCSLIIRYLYVGLSLHSLVHDNSNDS